METINLFGIPVEIDPCRPEQKPRFPKGTSAAQKERLLAYLEAEGLSTPGNTSEPSAPPTPEALGTCPHRIEVRYRDGTREAYANADLFHSDPEAGEATIRFGSKTIWLSRIETLTVIDTPLPE